jgi:hypothetical protein
MLFVLLWFSFGPYIVCPFFVFLWPLYCLSFVGFPLAIILFVLLSIFFGHYTVCPLVVFLWPLYCYNIMAKGKRKKDKQYKGQKKTTKGHSIMVKGKTRKRQTM